MPPKPKITRDMIVAAGLELVRTEGADSLNARRVAAALGCSTQPVMYHFKTVSDLKAAVYEAADALHTAFILTQDETAPDVFLQIGLQYIRFAAEEKQLFRFLFQSDQFRNMGFSELLNADALAPVITPLCASAGLSEAQAKEIFGTLFICVHGAASLIANNSIAYDEAQIAGMLAMTFDGLIAAGKGGAA